MKTLILRLMMAIFQASFAGGSQVGTLDNSSLGNFKTVNNGSETMGGSEVGNFKSVGNGFGAMGNVQGNMQLAGGGGGLRPDAYTKPSGHEI